MRPLWATLVAALVLVVVLAVGGATTIFYIEFPQRLEEELEKEFRNDVDRLRAELSKIDQGLDSDLAQAAERARGGGSSSRGTSSAWFWAQEQLRSEGAQLKVLAADGEVLSSGHWPASLGAIDPQHEAYSGQEEQTLLHREPLPFRSSVALQRWQRGSWRGREVRFVAGHPMDGRALEELRLLQKVDLLVLEDAVSGIRETSTSPDLDLPADFRPGAPGASELLRTEVLAIPKSQATLTVGRGRAEILAAQRGIREVLLLVGGASALVALLLALLVARQLARPVEALADTAGQLARGDLGARVEAGGSRVLEVQRLVDAFNQMADDIQRSQTRLVQAERVAAWREIARGLAHELKNPLTPILGAMDVIRKAHTLEREDFDEILDEQARAVVDEVMRLKELADEFAHFARLPDPHPEEVDVSAVLDGAVALYRSVDDTLRVQRDYADDTPTIEADRKQLQTVVTNLVKNALEAMGTSGTLSLSTGPCELDDGQPGALMRIGDSGPGIPEEVRDRLFMPYFTTKGSRGTGLGLALSHRIILEHGGSIEVGQSREGGAEFSLRLPVRPPPAPPRSEPEPS